MVLEGGWALGFDYVGLLDRFRVLFFRVLVFCSFGAWCFGLKSLG